jgi:hypothetical protein
LTTLHAGIETGLGLKRRARAADQDVEQHKMCQKRVIHAHLTQSYPDSGLAPELVLFPLWGSLRPGGWILKAESSTFFLLLLFFLDYRTSRAI